MIRKRAGGAGLGKKGGFGKPERKGSDKFSPDRHDAGKTARTTDGRFEKKIN